MYNRSMFHVIDGLYFEKAIGCGCSGYSQEEEIEQCYKIKAHVTETVTNREIIDGDCKTTTQQKVLKTYELDAYALASIMASMSVRGETTETFYEALEFLRKQEIA